MRTLKRIAISFSLYSRIPMPIFNWEDEDYRHAIGFLPLVGAVIGGLCLVLKYLDTLMMLPTAVVTLLMAVIPILVTGGFHLDGFMDVSDALHSYQGKEKSLEIMKDPHIGAFAVISLARYGLIYIAALFYLVSDYKKGDIGASIWLYAISFWMVRAVCGLTSIVLPKAKKEGMLKNETAASGNSILVLLIVFLVLSVLLSLWIAPFKALCCVAALGLYTLYYGKICEKRFGGVTGDTAGYFVCQGELVYLATLFAFEYISRFFV